MKTRPKEFVYLAISMATVALGFPLQVMAAYGYAPTELVEIATSLAPLNWCVMGVALLNAWVSLAASPALWGTLAAYAILVAWNDWIVAQAGLNGAPVLALLATLVAWAPLFSVLRKRAREVLLHPERRWWKTETRRRLRVSAVVRPVLSPEWSEIKAETFDVSLGGAFIALRDGLLPKPGGPLAKLKPGARCTVRLMINQIHVLQCAAEVVRASPKATGEYPCGFAVRFSALEPKQKALLGRFVANELPEFA